MHSDETCEDVKHTFHDASVYGMCLISPEPDQQDWRSELILDIDYILEWIKNDDGLISFRLVQAELCFVNVSDLRVVFGFPQVTINPLPIDQIVRSDRPLGVRELYREYRWDIVLNDGLDGKLTFRASGYRLKEIGNSITFGQQQIPSHLRIRSKAR